MPAQPPTEGPVPEQVEASPANPPQLGVLGPAGTQGQDPSGPAGSRVVDSEEYKKLLEQLMGDLLPGELGSVPRNTEEYEELLKQLQEANDIKLPQEMQVPQVGVEQQADSAASVDLVDSNQLTLADVIASVYQSFPDINAARAQLNIADGEILSAYGSFDHKLQAYTINEPTGFYENFRHGIGVARRNWWGTYLSAGYRIGRGEFQPWYKERETDDAGELKLGIGMPLLQGRAIDPARVAVFQASLNRQIAGPEIQATILQVAFEGTVLYWKWVAAGRALEVNRKLYAAAEERGQALKIFVEAGRFPALQAMVNKTLIYERRVKYLDTLQKFQASALKLSLYLRDANGIPVIPPIEWLPPEMPSYFNMQLADASEDLALALSNRPEPRILQLQIRKQQIDQQLESNNLFPRLDAFAEASQDMGDPASSSDDKSQFQLNVGLTGEVPIQRRKPRGKLQQIRWKIQQLMLKRQIVENKIGVELETSHNQLLLANEAVDQATLGLEAAREALRLYNIGFTFAKYNVIDLNIVEVKAFETEAKLIDEQQRWFIALAAKQAALGLDPLEQAVAVTEALLEQQRQRAQQAPAAPAPNAPVPPVQAAPPIQP